MSGRWVSVYTDHDEPLQVGWLDENTNLVWVIDADELVRMLTEAKIVRP